MHEDNRENLQNVIDVYSYIGLISSKIRVGIIGAGKAGTIKTRHFVNNKCYVEVLSQSFNEEIIELSKRYSERLKLIKKEFTYNFLKDKHLIVIALNDEALKKEVKKYCDENYKLYIDCSDFKNGMGMVPVERTTRNICFALNIKDGNPKGAVWVSDKVKEFLLDYDEFIGFTTNIRNRAKAFPEYKNKIVKFVVCEEFKILFNKGIHEESLKKHFPKEVVEYLLKE